MNDPETEQALRSLKDPLPDEKIPKGGTPVPLIHQKTQ